MSLGESITILLVTKLRSDRCVLPRHAHMFRQMNNIPISIFLHALFLSSCLLPLCVSTDVIRTDVMRPFLLLVQACEKNVLVTVIGARNREQSGVLWQNSLHKTTRHVRPCI
jgi:hypothetical protein